MSPCRRCRSSRPPRFVSSGSSREPAARAATTLPEGWKLTASAPSARVTSSPPVSRRHPDRLACAGHRDQRGDQCRAASLRARSACLDRSAPGDRRGFGPRTLRIVGRAQRSQVCHVWPASEVIRRDSAAPGSSWPAALGVGASRSTPVPRPCRSGVIRRRYMRPRGRTSGRHPYFSRRRGPPWAGQHVGRAGGAGEDAHAVIGPTGPQTKQVGNGWRLGIPAGVTLGGAGGCGRAGRSRRADGGTRRAACDRRLRAQPQDAVVAAAPLERRIERRRVQQPHASARPDRRGDEPTRVAAVGRARRTVEPGGDGYLVEDHPRSLRARGRRDLDELGQLILRTTWRSTS